MTSFAAFKINDEGTAEPLSYPVDDVWLRESNTASPVSRAQVLSDAVDMIQINRDPTSESTTNVRISMTNKHQTLSSNIFKIEIKCPLSGLEIFEPVSSIGASTISYIQVSQTTVVPNTYPKWDFDTFMTRTIACGVEQYEILIDSVYPTIPVGILD